MNKKIHIYFLITLIVTLIIIFVVFLSIKREKLNEDYKNFEEKNNETNLKFNEFNKITKEELERHNKKEDCWVIVNEKVYDITSLIDTHTGGKEIMNYCGKDATQAFNTKGSKNMAHSERANRLLQNYMVGELKNE